MIAQSVVDRQHLGRASYQSIMVVELAGKRCGGGVFKLMERHDMPNDQRNINQIEACPIKMHVLRDKHIQKASWSKELKPPPGEHWQLEDRTVRTQVFPISRMRYVIDR